MVILRNETPADRNRRDALILRAFGDDRGPRPSDRVRAGRLPAADLALLAEDGQGGLLGSVRLWHARLGSMPGLLLGPLAVDPLSQGRGVGSALLRRALNRAGATGHRAVVLVGEPAYYGRFGFSAAAAARLQLDTAVERHRFLALELVPGALRNAAGSVVGTGAPLPHAIHSDPAAVDAPRLAA